MEDCNEANLSFSLQQLLILLPPIFFSIFILHITLQTPALALTCGDNVNTKNQTTGFFSGPPEGFKAKQPCNLTISLPDGNLTINVKLSMVSMADNDSLLVYDGENALLANFTSKSGKCPKFVSFFILIINLILFILFFCYNIDLFYMRLCRDVHERFATTVGIVSTQILANSRPSLVQSYSFAFPLLSLSVETFCLFFFLIELNHAVYFASEKIIKISDLPTVWKNL